MTPGEVRRFCSNISTLVIERGAGFTAGLQSVPWWFNSGTRARDRFTNKHESVIHEFCHAVTLGYDFSVLTDFNLYKMENWITRQLTPKSGRLAVANEARTLAAEIMILRDMDVVENKATFLAGVKKELAAGHLCVTRALRYLDEDETKQRAILDAEAVIATINRCATARIVSDRRAVKKTEGTR